MLISIRVMAGHERIDRFQFVHETIRHQEVERTVHGGWSCGTRAITTAHAIQQVVGLDWLTSIGNQLQDARTDRRQPQATLAASTLYRGHESRCIIDMMLRVSAVTGMLAHD